MNEIHGMKAAGDGFIKCCRYAIEMSGILLFSCHYQLRNTAERSTSPSLLLHPGFNAFSISLPHTVASDHPRAFATRDLDTCSILLLFLKLTLSVYSTANQMHLRVLCTLYLLECLN